MNTTHTVTASPVRIAANYAVTKHLGNWTTAREFQVRAHRGHAVLDLRSPHIEDGEIRIDCELDHAMLKLLVPDGAVVDRKRELFDARDMQGVHLARDRGRDGAEAFVVRARAREHERAAQAFDRTQISAACVVTWDELAARLAAMPLAA